MTIEALTNSVLISVTSKDGTPIGLWKTGRGPSLLVVHGTGADHSAWDRVVPLLVDSFTIYAMDRRGRGASGDALEYALDREVEDVVAAVETLPRPVYVYGHSFGGGCVVEAATRTQRIDRLVLYEGGPKPAGLRLSPDDFIARLQQQIETGQREEALEVFMLNAAGVTRQELDVLRNHPSWRARLAAAHTIPRELRAINEYSADPEQVRTIGIAVLLVLGEKTDPQRREMFAQMTELFSNARITVLPGQRHAAHQTAPNLLAQSIRDFLLDN